MINFTRGNILEVSTLLHNGLKKGKIVSANDPNTTAKIILNNNSAIFHLRTMNTSNNRCYAKYHSYVYRQTNYVPHIDIIPRENCRLIQGN